MLDFNNAAPQRSGFDLIPNGTIVRCIGTIRPGGKSRPGLEAVDQGMLTQSKSSDVMYLSFEYVVTEGPYAKRRWWGNLTVCGGSVDERGESKGWNITKSTFRALLNCNRSIRPDDESPQAASGRQINSWADINGLEFLCKVKIQKGQDGYQDQNSIAMIIEPGHKDWVPWGTPMPEPTPGQTGNVAQFQRPAPAAAPSWAGPMPAATGPAPASPTAAGGAPAETPQAPAAAPAPGAAPGAGNGAIPAWAR